MSLCGYGSPATQQGQQQVQVGTSQLLRGQMTVLLLQRRQALAVVGDCRRSCVVQRGQPVLGELINRDGLPCDEGISRHLLGDLSWCVAGLLLGGVPPPHLLAAPGLRIGAGIQRNLLSHNRFASGSVPDSDLLDLRRKLLPSHRGRCPVRRALGSFPKVLCGRGEFALRWLRFARHSCPACAAPSRPGSDCFDLFQVVDERYARVKRPFAQLTAVIEDRCVMTAQDVAFVLGGRSQLA